MDTIKELLEFINVDATPDEVEALKELLHVKEGQKKILTYEDFYNLFVKDEAETQKESEKLFEAFNYLTPDQNGEEIDLERLKTYMKVYDQKYSDSYEELMSDADIISFMKGKKFNFKDYVDHVYKPKSK